MKEKYKLFAVSFIILIAVVITAKIVSIQGKYTLENIINGDYSGMDDQELAKTLGEIIFERPDDFDWFLMDMDDNGKEELILEEKDGNNYKRILGIFSMSGRKIICNLWDDTDTTEFFRLCNGHLIYYTSFWGALDIVVFQEYQYEENGKFNLIKGLELWRIDQEEAVSSDWRRDHPGLKEESVYYVKYTEDRDNLKMVTEQIWMEEFKELMGGEFQDMEPEIYYGFYR